MTADAHLFGSCVVKSLAHGRNTELMMHALSLSTARTFVDLEGLVAAGQHLPDALPVRQLLEAHVLARRRAQQPVVPPPAWAAQYGGSHAVRPVGCVSKLPESSGSLRSFREVDPYNCCVYVLGTNLRSGQ